MFSIFSVRFDISKRFNVSYLTRAYIYFNAIQRIIYNYCMICINLKWRSFVHEIFRYPSYFDGSCSYKWLQMIGNSARCRHFKTFWYNTGLPKQFFALVFFNANNFSAIYISSMLYYQLFQYLLDAKTAFKFVIYNYIISKTFAPYYLENVC